VVHLKERIYICRWPGCEKGFARKDNWMNHEKTHERKEKRRKVDEGENEEEKEKGRGMKWVQAMEGAQKVI